MKPRLTSAACPLTREIEILDASGALRAIHIPDERPLTVFVDKRELVTLMTLGQAPELLVVGYLLNQRLVADVREIESVTVDWSVDAAAVRTRGGIVDLEAKTARRVVTTGCGQGTVFGDILSELSVLRLPDARSARIGQDALFAILEVMRLQPCVHKQAGSVHGTALWRADDMLMFVEDVGRHNAVDTIAGWMAMNDLQGGDMVLYTTGRLTSEMVLKAARIGVPILISRNGVTAMALDLAQRLGMTLVGRAVNRRYLCYTGAERLDLDSERQAVVSAV